VSEQVPSVGRVVHYVLDEGPYKGEHRPATIVRVWGTDANASVNLQVLTDSDAEGRYNDCLSPVLWRTTVMRDDSGERPGSFHWPVRV
jgi:hypothetical protein